MVINYMIGSVVSAYSGGPHSSDVNAGSFYRAETVE
jgi:hypothetical protein